MIFDVRPWFSISRWFLPCNDEAGKPHTIYMSPRWGLTCDIDDSGIEVIFFLGLWRTYIRRRSNAIMATGPARFLTNPNRRWILNHHRR